MLGNWKLLSGKRGSHKQSICAPGKMEFEPCDGGIAALSILKSFIINTLYGTGKA
jgi:hypothetical protein